MILEHAIVHARPGSESDFEEAFQVARPLISRQPGFCSLSISRSIKSANLYLLLVEWDSVEAHTEGFRGFADYERWKELLHRFYDPFPVVEHFTTIR